MFFNKTPSREQQKEIRLTVLQMEKMIQKVLENVTNAVVSFVKSYEHLFKVSSESESELSRTTLYLDEFMSVHRHLNQNKEILKEIKSLVSNRYLRTPLLIQDQLRIVQEKNSHAIVALEVRDIERDAGKPELTFASEIILKKDLQADLLQLGDSVKDLQELVQKYFLVSSSDYVHENRLEELQSIETEDFDLAKLIRLCEELNSAYQNENYLSVIIVVRAILDHVPPIFGFKTFTEVSSQYGGKSIKKSLQNLQNSSRNIADAYLHEPIRPKESLPNETQIDFRNDLDVLLGEIVRVLK